MADTIVAGAHINAVVPVAVGGIVGGRGAIRSFADRQAIKRILV